MAATFFFQSSQNVTKRLGELFNFVWSTAAALWNLRWQVHGFVNATGTDDNARLHERFVKGSGITSADLNTSCIGTTWEGQQEQFAKFLLFELCGLYEAWLEDVAPRAVSVRQIDRVTKSLQFPTRPGPYACFADALRIVNVNHSVVMKAEVFPTLKAHRKNSWHTIEDMLVAYRYFKEIRNSMIHFGGRADTRVINARTELSAIPFAKLGLKEALHLPSLSTGDRVTVGLRNAVAFSSIVHRLIITLDAMLAVSQSAEKELLDHFREHNPKPSMLSKTDPARRQRQIIKMLAKAHVPRPVTTTQLEALLASHRLIV